jgi:serine protease AprX
VDYGHGVLPQSKPDLAAPGVAIKAARSHESLDLIDQLLSDIGHKEMQGTSMAAPHVTGAVALMLQKKNDLTVAQILTILRTTGQGARAVLPPKPDDFGAGKLDVKGAFDNVP